MTLDVALDRPLARFSPLQAIGGALDGHAQGETLAVYTPASLRAMSSAGLGAISYRLRTELGAQAWHFDSAGRWSDPAGQQGYWTSVSRPPRSAPIVSWGYELPRRGDTRDQAENSGYSRLDDGSAQTFWKSDPYLDSHYTHEAQSHHPQWVLIDLGRPSMVDALRIAWAAPYATRFRVQRYVDGPDAIALEPGRWTGFPHSAFRGSGGTQTLRLAASPVRVRFVRILMTASSHTAPPTDRRSTGSPIGQRDVRDRLGYAIRELYAGTLAPTPAPAPAPAPPSTTPPAPAEGFHDLLVHAPDGQQTTIYVSSTDSWHSAADLNSDYEQPSFQTVLRSGLTRGQPLLVPVPLLYGTPANALAELRYLRALHVRLRGVELGEEPDGQLTSPEDYGALYVQFARAIRRSFPHLPIGGPAFASSIPDWAYWPDAHGDRSWTRRFVNYLRARRALSLLSFFSFEWYPFDDVCSPPAAQLVRSQSMLRTTLAEQRREGIPRTLPIYVTEYGYSAYASAHELDMTGALFDADTVGTLLSEGIRAAYLYGYEPNVPIRESSACDTWGNLMLLRDNGPDQSPQPVAAFWETQMLTHDWTQPTDATHALYAVRLEHAGRRERSLSALRAYAVRRPDGRLSLLLLNMSPSRAYLAHVRLTSATARPRATSTTARTRLAGTMARTPLAGTTAGARRRRGLAGASRGARRRARLAGPLQEWTLSAADYAWHAEGPDGAPSLDEPPVHRVLPAGAPVALPPYSITVLRSALR